MAHIQRVWIEEGCISCSLCQDLCPEVFRVREGQDCVIEQNGPKFFGSRDEAIRDAVQDCPVEVIKLAEERAAYWPSPK